MSLLAIAPKNNFDQAKLSRKSSLDKWFSINPNASGLAGFRIIFALSLILEILQLFYFQPLLLEPELVRQKLYLGSLSNSVIETTATLLLGIHLASLVAIVLGWRMRISAAINYFCTVIFLGYLAPCLQFMYHADCLYLTGSLFLLLAPTNQRYSLDARANRATDAAQWYHVLFLMISMSVLYLDAVSWKMATVMWKNELGVWTPTSLPFMVFNDVPFLHNELLSKALSFSTTLLQFGFPIAILIRPWRVITLGVSAMFHAGLALSFPIPLFSVVCCAFLLAMIPGERPKLANPAAVHTANMLLVKSLCVLWLFAAVIINWINPSSILVPGSVNPVVLRSAGQKFCDAVYPFTGLYPHAVFLDALLIDYTQETRLVYCGEGSTEQVLPFLQPNGMTGPYSVGRMFCWYFLAFWPRTDETTRVNDLRRIAKFWNAGRKDHGNSGFIRIDRKPIIVSNAQWLPDVFERNLKAPWRTVGKIYYHHDDVQIVWSE